MSKGDDGRAKSARGVYELHLIHPTTEQRQSGQIRAMLVDLILMGTNPGVSQPYVKFTMEIVDRRTGETVLAMRESPETAQRLAEMVETDLGRLDAEAFAAEWGIKPNAYLALLLDPWVLLGVIRECTPPCS